MRQEKVDRVENGDQQDEEHYTQQDPQLLLFPIAIHFRNTFYRDLGFVRLRSILRTPLSVHGFHRRNQCLFRHIIRRSERDREPAFIGTNVVWLAQGRRHPQSGLQSLKNHAGWKDADNSAKLAVHDKVRPDDLGVSSKGLLPEPVAKDHHRGRSRIVVCPVKQSSRMRVQSQDPDKAFCNPQAFEPFRILPTGHRHPDRCGHGGILMQAAIL